MYNIQLHSLALSTWTHPGNTAFIHNTKLETAEVFTLVYSKCLTHYKNTCWTPYSSSKEIKGRVGMGKKKKKMDEAELKGINRSQSISLALILIYQHPFAKMQKCTQTSTKYRHTIILHVHNYTCICTVTCIQVSAGWLQVLFKHQAHPMHMQTFISVLPLVLPIFTQIQTVNVFTTLSPFYT